MPEITTTGFPFIDRIPMKDRGKAIERLGEWQAEHHPGTELDVIAAARRGKKDDRPDIVTDTPDYDEQHIEDLNQEMSQPPSRRSRRDVE